MYNFSDLKPILRPIMVCFYQSYHQSTDWVLKHWHKLQGFHQHIYNYKISECNNLQTFYCLVFIITSEVCITINRNQIENKISKDEYMYEEETWWYLPEDVSTIAIYDGWYSMCVKRSLAIITKWSINVYKYILIYVY